jgi:hypothetical protein
MLLQQAANLYSPFHPHPVGFIPDQDQVHSQDPLNPEASTNNLPLAIALERETFVQRIEAYCDCV